MKFKLNDFNKCVLTFTCCDDKTHLSAGTSCYHLFVKKVAKITFARTSLCERSIVREQSKRRLFSDFYCIKTCK